MPKRQMVINPSSYAISKEDIFDTIKNIASNQLFQCDIIVPNVCYPNNKGSNFLVEAQRVFPNLLGYDTYGKQKLGSNKFLEAAKFKKNRIFFCNMYAEKFGKNRNLNYFYLFHCMSQIRSLCLDSKKNNDTTIKIHTRKDAFGISNRNNNRWTTIADFMSDCWNGIEVTIHE